MSQKPNVIVFGPCDPHTRANRPICLISLSRRVKHPQSGPSLLFGSAAGRTPCQCQQIDIDRSHTHSLTPSRSSIYESSTSIPFILPLREPNQPNVRLRVFVVVDLVSPASYIGAEFKEVVKNPIIEYKQANLTVACTSSRTRTLPT